MKYIHYLYILGCFCIMGTCVSCTQDEFDVPSLTPEQQALIGTAVNFDASMAEEFSTRTSWNHTGIFNDADLMVIYRQYWDATAKDGQGEWTKDSYRSYSFDVKYATGTTVSLGRNWKVAPGRMGANWDETNNKLGVPFEQSAADSLTWENGTTVRFRAWSRSNLANYLNNGSANTYYPDYCIANWSTVSGPTQNIPLTLRHACSRIGFTCKAGNQFSKGEICLDPDDYKWNDNADTQDHDASDKLSEEEAESVCNAVNAVFNRMCMPAGVNIENGTLNAMTEALYDKINTEFSKSVSAREEGFKNGFKDLELKTTAQGIVNYRTLTPEQIASTVKHPQFNHNDGRLYMFAIPYDMSTAPTQGEELVLPAKTRFKIWLRDVNNGDAGNTGGYEYKEHVFSLSDVKDGDNPKYPNGLTLSAGKSYLFSVGYLYDKFTVDIIEEGMNWSTVDLGEKDLPNSDIAQDETREPFEWFKDAVNTAIGESKEAGQDYNPIFKLSTREDFVEFINLVNGDFEKSGIKRVQRNEVNPEYDKDADPEYKAENDPANYGGITDKKELDKRKKNYGGYYWWYDEAATATSIEAGGDTIWISKLDAAKRGYVIYNRYFPQLSTQAAHSEEVLLTMAYSFFDEQLPLHFVVQLENDIDLGDWKLETIGKSATTSFMGYFNGNMHTLKNVYMEHEHLFGYMTDGEIRNLIIESEHNTALLKEGTVSDNQNFRITGISLNANSTTNSIAEKLNWVADASSKTGRIYVVGCIQYGDAGGALVGESDNLYMLACMRTASNSDRGALLGKYSSTSTSEFFRPQTSLSALSWTSPRFLCNYFFKTPSLDTRAVGFLKDGTTVPSYKNKDKTINYLPQQYIRGAHDYVLKAIRDNLLGDDVSFDQLTSDLMKEEFYGLAPWKAMNYAIAKYNALSVATNHEYKMHNQDHKINAKYSVSNVGYKNLFPQLVVGAPNIETDGLKDPLKQNN